MNNFEHVHLTAPKFLYQKLILIASMIDLSHECYLIEDLESLLLYLAIQQTMDKLMS